MTFTQPIGPRDHVLGPPDAPVTLVEYMDYECPFCGQANRVVASALSTEGDLVRYVQRHFPLSQIHPHALLAAQAAEAAGAQGMFWLMHSTLLENQDALDLDALVHYADGLGMDVPRFTEDLRNGVYLPKVQDDYRTGVRSGVRGTPTFFVDGVPLRRGWDAASLVAAIREAARPENRVEG